MEARPTESPRDRGAEAHLIVRSRGSTSINRWSIVAPRVSPDLRD